MRQARSHAGLSLGDIERLTKKDVSLQRIPKTSLSEVLRKDKLPNKVLLHDFLRACGLPEDHIVRWDAARARIDLENRRSRLSGTSLLQPEIDGVAEQIAALTQELVELRDTEISLRRQLEEATRETERIAAEAEAMQTQLQEQVALKLQELEQVNQQVAELRNELRIVQGARERAEAAYERLVVERDNLESASDTIAALLDLHFQRAQFEHERFETSQVDNASLRSKVDQLEDVLGRYQKQTHQDAPRQIEASVLERLQNQDLRVEFPAGVLDFGAVREVPVAVGWLCPRCKRSGIRDLSVCPYCIVPTHQGATKLVSITLPFNPGYGKTIKVTGEGTHDEPLLRPGDLYVQIVEQPSTWKRFKRGIRYMAKGE